MIAVVTGTVEGLEAEGIRLRTETDYPLLVTLQIPAEATGLRIGDRLTVYGGPDPKRSGVWLSSSAYLADDETLEVPMTEWALTTLREKAARGERTILSRRAEG